MPTTKNVSSQVVLDSCYWIEYFGHSERAALFSKLIEADVSITLSAVNNGPPLADSLIYVTAQRHHATLWTQDAQFEGLPGVKYFLK
jgi:predicted nucleic acid-binding protein